MKVVGYVRVSTEEQASSLNQQRALIENFAKLRGFELVRIFEDKGISGAIPLIRRPGFVALLEFCEQNNIKTIIVTQMDRLTRCEDDSKFIKYELVLKRGFTIISIVDFVVLDKWRLIEQDPTARFADKMREDLRAVERQIIARRIRKGMVQKFPAGLTGYSSVYKVTEGDPTRYKEVALKIYDLFKRGLSIKKIAEEVGVSTKQVVFVLWLLGVWDVPQDTCPRCGSKRLRKEDDVFYVCTNCGFMKPISRDILYESVEQKPEFLISTYPRYVIEILKLAQEIKHHASGDLQTCQTT